MLQTSDIIIRLLVAALLGGIIGFERESHGRAAGFRTHLIVGVAGALIMIISQEFFLVAKDSPKLMPIDPGRLAAGALTGVGFLGAGVIVKYGFSVQGLTTAACLWIVSAVGLAAGSGFYFPASFATILTVIALWGLRKVERKVSRTTYKLLSVAAAGLDKEREIREIVREMQVRINDIDYDLDRQAGEVRFHLTVSASERFLFSELVARISTVEGVKSVSIRAS